MKKLEIIQNNEFYLEEKQTLEDSPKVASYYQYIIDNVEIDRANPNNSYIMWLNDKVDVLDQSKPANINPGNISLPDIDMDVPATKRDNIIQYIKDKYGGDEHVSQMITFQSMKGRGALKDVLRAYGTITFEEMNLITQHIPDEASIADDLQDMKEEDGFSSIIMWALENNKEKLSEWCELNEDGTLSGPLAKEFAQAIRLEGTKTNSSKHAAGIVISPEPLHKCCPMIYDSKTKKPIAAFEMKDLESIGMVKLDILGLSLLDKIMGVSSLLRFGEIK